VNLLALPGLDKMSSAFVRGLVDLAQRNGWDPSGIALVIYSESRFIPSAHNPLPGSSATGLLQFIESTAKMLGTTTAAIAKMSAEEQLPLVEKYFQMTLKGKVPDRFEDYYFPVLGRSDLVGKPDDTIIWSAGSEEYDNNKGLDGNKDGVITVGDIRNHMDALAKKAKGYIVVGVAVGAELLFWGAGAALLYMKSRKRRTA